MSLSEFTFVYYELTPAERRDILAMVAVTSTLRTGKFPSNLLPGATWFEKIAFLAAGAVSLAEYKIYRMLHPGVTGR